MENLFLKSNDGLARRLSHVLHMEDYNNEELGEIKCKYNGVLAEMLITEAVYKLEERLEGEEECMDDLHKMSFLTIEDLSGGMDVLQASLVQKHQHEDLFFMTERFHTVSTQTSWDGENIYNILLGPRF